ncbi:MAG: ATP-dependent helicase, partial [Pseudomonadota bacterium]
ALELANQVDCQDRMGNLEELVAAAAAYDEEAGDEASLAGFLERIALVGTADEKDGREAGPDSEETAVTLMTIHAAKGLEFPVVFIPGLEEGIFPSLRDGDGDEDIAEERRLAYVAFTRAREQLVLLHARSRRVWDNFLHNDYSRFLDEIPQQCKTVRRCAPAKKWMTGGREHQDERERGCGFGGGGSYDFDQRSSFGDEPVFSAGSGYKGIVSAGTGKGAARSTRRIVTVEEADDDAAFPRGVLVRHKVFGIGSVEGGSGRGPDRKLEVRFPQYGVKTIVARFVQRT